MICSSNSGFGLQSKTTGVFERGDRHQPPDPILLETEPTAQTAHWEETHAQDRKERIDSI